MRPGCSSLGLMHPLTLSCWDRGPGRGMAGRSMDNITIARLLEETAALLEIDAADPFRIRSYRRAAEAVEQQTAQLAAMATPESDPKELLAIPGIGKGMAANIRDLVATGTMPLRE